MPESDTDKYDTREVRLVAKAIELLGEDEVCREGTTVEWHDGEPALVRGHTMLSLGQDGRLHYRRMRGSHVAYGVVTPASFEFIGDGMFVPPGDRDASSN